MALARWWYALKQGFLGRKTLKRFLVDPTLQVHALAEITPQRLEQANVAVLILDFDGVLANHDAPQPSPHAQAWLQSLTHAIGEQRVAVLTNNPMPARLGYFKQHFPSIHIVQGVRKKPYPDGILEVARFKGLDPHRVLLVDDRLLTGILASKMAYSQAWYFCPPCCDYRQHPVKEVFFSFLRVMERAIFRYLG